jgi:hemerythrin-like domain-containing protein
MPYPFIEPVQDFSNGLEVLRSYHEDFLARGSRLLDLVEDIHRHGMNVERASECLDLQRYYVLANTLHHQDEERALFPLLVNRFVLIDGMLERLVLDHEEIEAAWEALAPMLSQPGHIAETQALLALTQTFEKLQREHVIRENQDFFPKVESLLSAEQCQAMGRKMRGLRRNIRDRGFTDKLRS